MCRLQLVGGHAAGQCAGTVRARPRRQGGRACQSAFDGNSPRHPAALVPLGYHGDSFVGYEELMQGALDRL